MVGAGISTADPGINMADAGISTVDPGISIADPGIYIRGFVSTNQNSGSRTSSFYTRSARSPTRNPKAAIEHRNVVAHTLADAIRMSEAVFGKPGAVMRR